MSANHNDHPPPQGSGIDQARSRQLNEDWIATIIGLALLVLCLAGVITPDLVP